MRALAALGLCACTGTVGTIQVELVTAPGSSLLEGVQRIEFVLTDPPQVKVANRTASGFDLALEVDASNAAGVLIVKGLGADGNMIACGQTPRFPESAINATIAIYMAPPRSIALAPSELTGPRSEVSATAISYGAVLAGGRDGGSAPSSSISVYNAFDHTLVEGTALPAARTGLAMAAGVNGGVYLFGGSGPDGAATGTMWRFDTTVAPSGLFQTVASQPGYARSGEALVPIGRDRYMITGRPVLEYLNGGITSRTDFDMLPATTASSFADDGTPSAIFVGPSLVWRHGDTIEVLPGTGRNNAAVTTLPDGRFAVIGGSDPAPGSSGSLDAIVIDSVTGAVNVIASVLTTPRSNPAIATTPRHVVVAGGTDASGMPIASAEILDASTLMPRATLPILSRSGGFAVPLPNDQVLLGGGAPPAAALELFTPEPSQ